MAFLSYTGLIGWGIKDGTFNADVFVEVISTCLIPHLKPFPQERSIVVCDGASIHKDPRVQQMVLAKGALLVMLPPYSPEFNPIEKVFSIVKM